MFFVLGGLCLAGCAGAKQHRMGKTLMDAGDYDRAVALLREAVAKDPGNGEYIDRLSDALTQAADVHYDKGKTLHTQHRPGEAAKELALALDYMPGHPEAVILRRTVEQDVAVCSRWRKQAEEAVAREDWDEAMRLADQAYRADRGDAEAAALFERTRSAVISRHLVQAQVALGAGDREKCLDECARVKLLDASNLFVAQIEQRLGKADRSSSASAVAPASQPVAQALTAAPAPQMRAAPAAAPTALPAPTGTVAVPATRPAAPADDAPAPAARETAAVVRSEAPRTGDAPTVAAQPPRVSTPAPGRKFVEIDASPPRIQPSPQPAANAPAPAPTAASGTSNSGTRVKPRPAPAPPLIEVREPTSGRLLARSADPINGVGGEPPGAAEQREDPPREREVAPAPNGVRPVVRRETTLPGATFFTKRAPTAQTAATATRPASTQPAAVSGYVITAPSRVTPSDLTAARPPQPVAGRIVTARPKGLVLPPAEQRPGSPQRLFRGTVSRDDDRYDKAITTVDGIEVKVRDTDESPLDADLEITADSFHVEPDDLPVGASIRIRGVSGRAYRLVIIWIDDRDETVHFAIDTLD